MKDQSEKLQSLKINRARGEQESPGGKSWKKWLIPGAVVVAVAAALLIFWPFSGTPPEPVPLQDPAPDTAAGIGATTESSQNSANATQGRQILNASGYITARRKATVSAQITGRVEEVLVEEGMVVEEGQIVARLDDTLAQVDLDLAKASVRSAEARIGEIEADLAEAKRVLARYEELIKQKNISEAALTQAQARVETLTSSLERAKADLQIARLQVARQQETVDQHIIRAPFGGVVVDKNAQPGEMISPISAGGGFTRTGICTLVDMDSLEIEIDVNESYIGRVFAGQEVVANLDAYPGWDIPARVIAVVPTANRDKATVAVRIGLEARDPRILPEMGVQVAFIESSENP